MTSIYREIVIEASAAQVWPLLRDPCGVARAFAGALVDASLDGDVRTVVFASGDEVRERIVAIDEARMRVAYTVVGGRFEHHHASMRVVPDGERRCRMIWVSDFLPDAARPFVEPLIDEGCVTIARNLGA
jgi:carbon monoxide dehydrogenase subunit G